ncbi:MAG: S41 family peptidase, partial [Alphaproteobacteria bacterium]|nr:S41 family peptidase [Alphaproteobacteria bacterium]
MMNIAHKELYLNLIQIPIISQFPHLYLGLNSRGYCMRNKLALLMTYALLMTSCAVQHNPGIQDLDFIYTSILENHPGVYNNGDPNFCKNLETSYETATLSIKASQVNSSAKLIISDFAKSFNDPHLWVEWIDNINQKQNDTRAKFSISKFSNETVWITLSTFNLNSEEEKDFKKLVKQIPNLSSKKYIIFDLRGNQGGNSDYGSQIINALFGMKYAQEMRCTHNKETFADWRASDG